MQALLKILHFGDIRCASQLQKAHVSTAAPAGHPDSDGELAGVGHFDRLRRAGASGGNRPKVQARCWQQLPPGATTSAGLAM